MDPEQQGAGWVSEEEETRSVLVDLIPRECMYSDLHEDIRKQHSLDISPTAVERSGFLYEKHNRDDSELLKRSGKMYLVFRSEMHSRKITKFFSSLRQQNDPQGIFKSLKLIHWNGVNIHNKKEYRTDWSAHVRKCIETRIGLHAE